MRARGQAVPAGATAAARVYLLICMAALFVILMEEMAQVRDHPLLLLLAVLPSAAAGLALATRSNLASLMLLFALAGRILVYQFMDLVPWHARPTSPASRFQPADLLLSAAVLAFVVAHYRLMGLLQTIFPRDPRRRPPGPPGDVQHDAERQPRSARLVQPLEWVLLILALPLWVVLGQLAWLALPGQWAFVDTTDWLWHWTALITPAWLLAAALITAAGLFGYWGLRNRTRAEAEMFLQDTLWHETRREQRWVGRWLTWCRLRRPRRGGPS
jgi:hypothetical protein